eukprot:g16967.t1
MDISFQVVARDGNREVQEGERGIKDGPGELNVGVEGVSEVGELFELLVGARGGADTAIDVTEEEVGNRASVASEEALFHISYKEAGIAWVHAVPMVTPFVCRKWEVLKDKDSSDAVWPAVFIQLYTLLSLILQHWQF